ncbi:MAG: hypothetical protein H0W55_00970 [Actinobacteria bacterium]|nr:hypothetical protein [Actinomycetota bacterium]MDQ3533559.1 hypothetical protein [Actinomycetota bacterium]
MSRATVRSLVRQGRIEEVEADVEGATSKLEEACRHLGSAESIASTDPSGPTRCCTTPLEKLWMPTCSPRDAESANLDSEPIYAMIELARGSYVEHIKCLDRMRRNRNRSEYGIWDIGASTVERDLEHARKIVEAVERDLRVI